MISKIVQFAQPLQKPLKINGFFCFPVSEKTSPFFAGSCVRIARKGQSILSPSTQNKKAGARTAFWYASNKLDVFGKRSASNAPAEPLNSRNFCLTPKDRENVLKSRDEIAACMTSPLAYPRIGIEAAWRKVYNLPKMERTKERYKNKEIELKIS